jgi:hypothetical protein
VPARSPPALARKAVTPKARDNAIEDAERAVELRALGRIEAANLRGEGGHPARSPAKEQGAAFRRRANAREASVGGVGLARDEPVFLQRRHESCHRRRPNLFRVRQLTEGERSAEHDHRQRRQARRAESRRRVLPAEPAEEVDRRRVKAVRDHFGLITRIPALAPGLGFSHNR